MGIIKSFEHRLERALEGTFSKVFKVGVHPIEVAKRVSRLLEEEKSVAPGEVLAPNRFEIYLSDSDYRRFEGYRGVMQTELEKLVIDQAQRRRYTLLTRPTIEFILDEGLIEGDFRVSAKISAGSIREPSRGKENTFYPEGPKTVRGWIEVLEGKKVVQSVQLRPGGLRIGRAEDNDLVLEDMLVSRHHAIIEMTPGGYLVRDLHSTNGTAVNGRQVMERLLEDGDLIMVGGTRLLVRLPQV